MQQSAKDPRAFRFGVFEINVDASEVRKHGLRIGLNGQPFQILVTLLERAGDVVTRQELQAKLWLETTVDFDHSLNVAVHKIREVLGDSAESPRFVETLPRLGYRFIAPVEQVISIAPVSDLSSEDRKQPQAVPPLGTDQLDIAEGALQREKHRPQKQKFPWHYWVVSLGTLIALVVWLIGFRASKARESFLGSPTAPRINSIAVLPFGNLSGDAEQEYFADGLTDMLISDLGQIGRLRVVSRTSAMAYKQTNKPLPEIARALNVDAVVEGTILRSGDRVRITASLLYASTDQHLWSRIYEEDIHDAFRVQREMALAIVNEIRGQLSPTEEQRWLRIPSVDSEAHLAYLKGRFWWNKRTEEGFSKAVEYFLQAIEKDPNYGPAYAGLADAYLMPAVRGFAPPHESYPRALTMVTKALEVDDTLADAHTTLGYIKKNYDWDWSGAEKEFQRAIALNPGYALAHQWYAHLLSILGRGNEALAEAKQAQALDPLSTSTNRDVGLVLYRIGDYDQAIVELRNTIEIDPNFALTYITLSNVYFAKGMYPEAIAEREKAAAFSSDSASILAGLGRMYALSGNKAEALKTLDALTELSKSKYVSPMDFVLVYAGLGDKEKAFLRLERAYEERSDALGRIKVDPVFDSLRSDPRLQDLVRRMGLPQS